MALQLHPLIKGAVTSFSAYADFNRFPPQVRSGCQKTGVELVDVPNGRKDDVDKAILVDMFVFALDNPSPSSIILISGDVDYAHALHVLGQRGYTVIVITPSRSRTSSVLHNACQFALDWTSVAHGEGLLSCVERGQSKFMSYRFSSRLKKHPSVMNQVSVVVEERKDCSDVDQLKIVNQSIEKFKYELQELLGFYGNLILLDIFEVAYQQRYKRPLSYNNFGVTDLEELLGKLNDAVKVMEEPYTKMKFFVVCSDQLSTKGSERKEEEVGRGDHGKQQLLMKESDTTKMKLVACVDPKQHKQMLMR